MFSGAGFRSAAPLAGSWVSLFVSSLEPRSADVGVNLSCHQRLVSQQLLHASNVGSSVEQMRCETVPQGVGRRAEVEPRELQVFLQHSSHTACRQTRAELVQKDGRAISFWLALGEHP